MRMLFILSIRENFSVTQYQEYSYFEQLAWCDLVDLVNHTTDWKAQSQA